MAHKKALEGFCVASRAIDIKYYPFTLDAVTRITLAPEGQGLSLPLCPSGER